MRLFKDRKNKPGSIDNLEDVPIIDKRTINLNSHNQEVYRIKSDYSSILKKCKQDLEILKEQVVDFTRELEIK